MFNSYEFLKEISYVRTSGSPEELKCANTIKKQIEKFGGKAELESFDVDYTTIKEASLIVNGKEYNVTGIKMSGSTPKEGITKEFLYVENCTPTNLALAKDKIVLVNMIGYDAYKSLTKAGVSGIITMDGSIYDDINNTDLGFKALRERHTKNGVIPGVNVRISDAQEIIISNPKEVTIKVIQEQVKVKSHNVVSTIKGELDETIVFTAHFDSVPFSTGAYDNGTGSVTILDLYNKFIKTTPKRTLKFVWCGSEEVGLLGSKAFVNTHKDELENYRLCINIDMTGVIIGRDIAVCTSSPSLVSFIDYTACLSGFPISCRQGVYSSDSTPFAYEGIPAVSFARMSTSGGVEFHSRKDCIDAINPEVMNKTTNFVYDIAEKLISAVSFPVVKEMPDNMKKDLDKYLGIENKKESK